MKPRTFRAVSLALDLALAGAVGAWAGFLGAYLATREPSDPSRNAGCRNHHEITWAHPGGVFSSPAVSSAGAFPCGGWVAAGDSSSPEPAPENARMEIDQTFLDALAALESGGDDGAIGACGGVGRYQIRADYLADGNAALGTRYTLAEMHDPDKAARIVTAYLTRYGSAWERRTGLTATDEVLARLHNGGPRGPDKAATRGYADRILAVLGRR